MTLAKKTDQNYDYMAKLLLIGDSGVGKTNILLRFSENCFHCAHMTTIGIDFMIKTVVVDDKKMKLQIWDTAGQERFRTITQTYFKGSNGVMVVYAIDKRDSFQNIQSWLSQIKQHVGDEVCVVIIGNKIDLSATRVVSFQEGKDLATSLGFQFFETSAKDDQNITDAFQTMAKLVKDAIESSTTDIQPTEGQNTTTQLNNKVEPQSKKRCC